MKNIITAIGNTNLNMELRNDKYFNVISQDIQYQDGIFELLEQTKSVDFLIVSEAILGELSFLELIKKVININNKINIYIILENENEEIQNELKSIKIKNIFYSNKIEIKELIGYLKNEHQTEEEKLKEEIENLKELILKNKIDDKKDKTDNLIITKKCVLKDEKKDKSPQNNQDVKSICITGAYGSGKSITALLIAQYYERQNKKVLILDFDIYNQSIHTILGIKIKNNNEEKILKVSQKTSIFTEITDFLDSEKSFKIDRFNRFLEYIKNEYDILIIDTSSNIENDYMSKILKLCSKIIFLIEPNLSEISKSLNLLDYYLYKLNVKKEKINIIFNKANKNMIDFNILKNVFYDIKIIGKIDYQNIYTECINTNKIKCLANKKLLKLCDVILK